MRNCQVATTGKRLVDPKKILKLTLLKQFVQNPFKICQSVEPNCDPKLWWFLISKQAQYAAHIIYNVVMPPVRHEATSQKQHNIVLVIKHAATSTSSCKVATACITWSTS